MHLMDHFRTDILWTDAVWGLKCCIGIVFVIKQATTLRMETNGEFSVRPCVQKIAVARGMPCRTPCSLITNGFSIVDYQQLQHAQRNAMAPFPLEMWSHWIQLLHREAVSLKKLVIFVPAHFILIIYFLYLTWFLNNKININKTA